MIGASRRPFRAEMSGPDWKPRNRIPAGISVGFNQGAKTLNAIKADGIHSLKMSELDSASG